jgi:hypothetical protein
MLLAAGSVASRAQTAATVPISPHSVTLKVVTADGRGALVSVLNGGLAQLSLDEGPTLGITPVLEGDEVRLAFFEVLTRPTGESYGLRQLDDLRLGRGVPRRYVWKNLVVDVSWEGVEPVSEAQFQRAVAAAVAPALSNAPAGPPGSPCLTCCVTCGGLRVCGCMVVTDCGSCCCPDACACSEAGALP